ncbi:MAG TPA: hypothetical protein EYQ81_07525, partial [Sneathiellales bacterium]|nr:hypothetical protein [Sneathiellales bacterium]
MGRSRYCHGGPRRTKWRKVKNASNTPPNERRRRGKTMGEWYKKQTFGLLPAEAARRWGDREALCFKDRRWTFAEFADEVDRVAKGLIALGVQPGEKVSLWMNNKPAWLFLMYAIPKVG